jgi:hypothetical protein
VLHDDHLNGTHTRDSQSPGPHPSRGSPPVLNKKTGIDYWESFPIDSVENIRRWQEDCASHSSHHQTAQRNSIDEAGSNTNPLALLNGNSSHSRPGSADFTHRASRSNHNHNSISQSAPFRSMSTDSYPDNNHKSHHPKSQTAIPALSQHQSSSNAQIWQSPFLPTNSTTSSPQPMNHTHTSSPSTHNNDLNSQALLLQNFVDQNWTQQTDNMHGMALGITGDMSSVMPNTMDVDSGVATEVDSGFFSGEMQRRLFW